MQRFKLDIREIGPILAGLGVIRDRKEGREIDWDVVDAIISDDGRFEALTVAELNELIDRINS
jgi:hypothetical protein